MTAGLVTVAWRRLDLAYRVTVLRCRLRLARWRVGRALGRVSRYRVAR